MMVKSGLEKIFFGTSFAILWEFFRNYIGILWEFYGNSLGILEKFFGNSLGVLGYLNMKGIDVFVKILG